MDVFKKARELGWEIKQVTATRPYKYEVRRIGWFRKDGPPADTHRFRGKKELEAFLNALPRSDSSER